MTEHIVLLTDTQSNPSFHKLSFMDYSTAMTKRLQEAINSFVEAPLSLNNQLICNKTSTPAHIEVNMRTYKARQEKKPTIEAAFSIKQLGPTYYGVVFDVEKSLGQPSPGHSFYQEKYLQDFNTLEAEHFDMIEACSEIFTKIETSFYRDNMKQLVAQPGVDLSSEALMWSDIVQEATTLLVANGIENTAKCYAQLKSKKPVAMG